MRKPSIWVSDQVRHKLYKHRRWLEAGNFGFVKDRNRTIRVAKTKALISVAVMHQSFVTTATGMAGITTFQFSMPAIDITPSGQTGGQIYAFSLKPINFSCTARTNNSNSPARYPGCPLTFSVGGWSWLQMTGVLLRR